jgi:hypothetical protein
VISNGVDEAFQPLVIEKPPEWRDKFVILMVGRLSAEKRQDLIIKAARMSKHADDIQLVFLGKGPKLKQYERLGRKLKNKPVFRYVGQEEIVRIYNQADLYVHAAEVEIEAIVCLEAIACGVVPVIANAKMSAARQFALDERSLFKNKSVRDLAGKIDYWIEHPEERAQMGERCQKRAGAYAIERSIDKIEDVYRRVIAEQRPGSRHLLLDARVLALAFVDLLDELLVTRRAHLRIEDLLLEPGVLVERVADLSGHALARPGLGPDDLVHQAGDRSAAEKLLEEVTYLLMLLLEQSEDVHRSPLCGELV